jgi:hypothetical protein
MNHATELPLPIPVAIELAPELDGLLDAAKAASVELERDLAEETRSLGLQGKPIVEPLLSSGGSAIRIRVHNRLQPYPASEMARAWAVVAPPELSDLVAMPDDPLAFPDEWFREWARTRDGGDPSGSALVASFMRELVHSVILRRPECLVGNGQVKAFLSDRQHVVRRIGRDAAERDAHVLLRSLLALGLSVRETDVVWVSLATGQRLGRGVEDSVEAAAAALRPHRIEVHAHPSLLPDKQDAQANLAFEADLMQMEVDLFQELGIRLPDVEVRAAPELPEQAIRVRINHCLGAVRVGVTTLVEALRVELRDRGSVLLGIEDVEYLLSRLDDIFPELVSASLERLSLADLTRVLRALVAERVSIRDIRAMLERLLQFETIPVDPLDYLVIDERLPVTPEAPSCLTTPWRLYLAFVRSGSGLRNQLTASYGEGAGVVTSVPVIQFDREFEGRIRAAAGAAACGDDAQTLEQLRDELLEHVRAGLTSRPPWLTRETPALLVADPLLRPLIRELTASELPDLPVVVASELRPDVPVRRVDEAAAESPEAPAPKRPTTPTRARLSVLGRREWRGRRQRT